MQFQAALRQTSLERFANALRLHLIPTMRQPVIRIPTPPEIGERPRHPEIKCIVHEEVGEDRAHRTPLWGAAASLDYRSILLHHRRCQPSFDVEQRPCTRHMFPDGPQQELVIDVVEQSFDVELYNPIVLPAPLSRDAYGIESRFAGSVAIGIRQKDWVESQLNQCLTTVCATRSATVGTPRILWPPLFFGMETARTGGGK